MLSAISYRLQHIVDNKDIILQRYPGVALQLQVKARTRILPATNKIRIKARKCVVSFRECREQNQYAGFPERKDLFVITMLQRMRIESED